MNTIELEDYGYDDQLARAVKVDQQAPAGQAAANRAAMLRRQGIDGGLAYSANVVRQIEHEQACERAHQRAERAIKALIVCVLVGLYFGLLA